MLSHLRVASRLNHVLAAAISVYLAAGGDQGTFVFADDAAPAEIADLIRLLDADRFEDRERAARRLAEIGLPALEALRQAQQQGSSEARHRARELVRGIVHGPRLRELAAFAALPDEKLDVASVPRFYAFLAGILDAVK